MVLLERPGSKVRIRRSQVRAAAALHKAARPRKCGFFGLPCGLDIAIQAGMHANQDPGATWRMRADARFILFAIDAFRRRRA